MSIEPPELSSQEVDEMREWFHYFDKNGDGELDRTELKKVFLSVAWNITDQQFDKIFQAVDTDDNGTICYDEYVQLLQMFRKDKYQEKVELLENFRHFDKDRSGTIEKSELRRFLMSKGLYVNARDKAHLDKLLSLADKNNDGVIDREEFVNLMVDTPRTELTSL